MVRRSRATRDPRPSDPHGARARHADRRDLRGRGRERRDRRGDLLRSSGAGSERSRSPWGCGSCSHSGLTSRSPRSRRASTRARQGCSARYLLNPLEAGRILALLGTNFEGRLSDRSVRTWSRRSARWGRSACWWPTSSPGPWRRSSWHDGRCPVGICSDGPGIPPGAPTEGRGMRLSRESRYVARGPVGARRASGPRSSRHSARRWTRYARRHPRITGSPPVRSRDERDVDHALRRCARRRGLVQVATAQGSNRYPIPRTVAMRSLPYLLPQVADVDIDDVRPRVVVEPPHAAQ